MTFVIVKKILKEVGNGNRRQIFWTILIGFIVAFFEVLGVGAVVPLVSLILNKEALFSFLANYSLFKDISSISHQNLVSFVLIVVTLIFITKFIVSFYYFKKQAYLQKDIQIFISDKLLNIYVEMPYSRHLKYNSSKFFRNMQSEIGLLSNTVLLLMNLFSEFLMIFGIMILMLIYDLKSTLFLFSIFSIAGILYYYFFRKKIHFLGKSRFDFAQKRVRVLQDIFSSIKVGKVHDLTSEYAYYYKNNNDAMSLVGSKLKILSSMPKLLFEFLAILIILSIVYFQLSIVNSSPEQILATLALFSVAAIRLMPSANKILTTIQSLKSSLPGTKELLYELALDITSDQESIKTNIKSWSLISAKKLSFRYPNVKQKTLSNINFEIYSGEVVGIYGQSGSGKSTLIDLMIGLLSPSSGSILIDSNDLSVNRKNWMQNIGYVPQETYLLDSNILHNIVGKDYTTNKVNRDQLDEALKISGLDKVITKMSEKEMSRVGQGGSSLSGGQKQRVGIARAIYRKPSLLILDEPTSSLDAESKDIFRDLMIKYKNIFTFIIISHDQKDMEICNKVYEIADGRIKSVISNKQ
jgi:ABC-type bacteriocin/lantibiotic exporter with double-glycine peptidase domain